MAKENFPEFAFPDLLKEVQCIRHRIAEISKVSRSSSPKIPSVS
jgi:hypothetical protein